jgi:hypothetical protein
MRAQWSTVPQGTGLRLKFRFLVLTYKRHLINSPAPTTVAMRRRRTAASRVRSSEQLSSEDWASAIFGRGSLAGAQRWPDVEQRRPCVTSLVIIGVAQLAGSGSAVNQLRHIPAKRFLRIGRGKGGEPCEFWDNLYQRIHNILFVIIYLDSFCCFLSLLNGLNHTFAVREGGQTDGEKYYELAKVDEKRVHAS